MCFYLCLKLLFEVYDAQYFLMRLVFVQLICTANVSSCSSVALILSVASVARYAIPWMDQLSVTCWLFFINLVNVACILVLFSDCSHLRPNIALWPGCADYVRLFISVGNQYFVFCENIILKLQSIVMLILYLFYPLILTFCALYLNIECDFSFLFKITWCTFIIIM